MSKLGSWCALAVVLATATLYAAPSIRVVPLERDGHVVVSFELADGFTEQVRAAIQSGLTTSFTYTVDLRLDVPIWVDRTISSATVTASVDYDNLTRRHHLARQLDGRIEDARVTDDEEVVRRWLTHFERLPLFDTADLEPNREYYIRVRGRARPQNGWALFNWGDGPLGMAKFTLVR
jgi:hypothetical protein